MFAEVRAVVAPAKMLQRGALQRAAAGSARAALAHALLRVRENAVR